MDVLSRAPPPPPRHVRDSWNLHGDLFPVWGLGSIAYLTAGATAILAAFGLEIRRVVKSQIYTVRIILRGIRCLCTRERQRTLSRLTSRGWLSKPIPSFKNQHILLFSFFFL